MTKEAYSLSAADAGNPHSVHIDSSPAAAAEDEGLPDMLQGPPEAAAAIAGLASDYMAQPALHPAAVAHIAA
jgi:hypothetical protein